MEVASRPGRRGGGTLRRRDRPRRVARSERGVSRSHRPAPRDVDSLAQPAVGVLPLPALLQGLPSPSAPAMVRGATAAAILVGRVSGSAARQAQALSWWVALRLTRPRRID